MYIMDTICTVDYVVILLLLFLSKKKKEKITEIHTHLNARRKNSILCTCVGNTISRN